MKKDLLITNCLLLADAAAKTPSGPGFIAVAGGRIMQTGAMADCPEAHSGTVLDAAGQLAMPGLVNGHCHMPMTLLRGLADDLDLHTWLHAHIFPAEARLVTPEMVYWCSQLAAVEMLLSGTTTVADGYFFEDEVARACVTVGLRCVAAQAVIDFPAPGVPEPGRNIEVAQEFVERWQGRHPLIRPAIFAHAPYTCSNTTLRRAKELALSQGVPLFIHVAETAGEQGLIAEPQGPTPLVHLYNLGLLDRDTVCVHGVWLSEADIDLLAASGAGLITCPQSNAKLASGRAPLAAMVERGLRLGIGTDGAASGNSLDLFREMGFAARLHKVQPNRATAMPARTVLSLATKGGAAVLGMEKGSGTLQAGAAADILLIDQRQPHLQPWQDASTLVYSDCGADVRTVIVNGQIVVRERVVCSVDVAEVLARVRHLARAGGLMG